MPSDSAASSSDLHALQLLGIGLRSRAATVADLAGLAVRDETDVRRDLARLESEGFVVVRGDEISYTAPEDAVAEVVRRRAGDLGAEMLRRLAELSAVVGQLPALSREWDTGAGQHLADIEVFHGPEAVVDLWHVKQAKEPSHRTDVVLPDASRLFVADPAMQKVWHEASAGEDRHARVLASIADATHPAAQDRIAQELAGGVQIRMLADPPSWFWITDDSAVAVPLVWGEKWPTSVMLVRSRSVAGMARWLFDRMWERAVPVRSEQNDWDPLLTLMNGGATLEAAARALRISERTGRRRVAEAMTHFRVGSMLELGVAWSNTRRD